MDNPKEGLGLYLRFAEIFNDRDYDALDSVLARDFIDHHPGLVDVTSLDVYRRNLAFIIGALDMKATVEDIGQTGDKVFTRIRLTGKHVGRCFGLEPTGNALHWYTHELWRFQDGRLAERWAVDDLAGLFSQMGEPMPAWE